MEVFMGKQHPDDDAIALCKLWRDRIFRLSMPTLDYAGAPKAQMMASDVYHTENDLESIMA
jgi:hypothetical protein